MAGPKHWRAGAVLLGLAIGLGGAQLETAHAEGDVDEPITAQVRALPVPTLAPGQTSELSLVLLEAPERELPLLTRVQPSELALVENRLGWSAVVDPLAVQPRLRVPIKAPAVPGSYEVRASVDYFVCSEQWCRAKHGELRWTLVVAEPVSL
ncbi:hypothetical protein [Enhygromyxa salina]|uniref:Thiol:disulfide interchange protein DsbD N-terminal domain-containing protein n=1 Tax=Enhygromyxa salina TaxID=215803 RepID=A0A2S9YDM9_9BACT|nr:hypothetical protein [Enhygromyxa salina]PRQ03213.1 hypothetical protein ENSA7_53540 [Enhygromyxa salina]